MGTNQRKRRTFRRQFVLLLLLCAGVGAALYYYVLSYNRTSQVAAHFVTETGTSGQFWLEVANTDGLCAKGLMFRKPHEMRDDQGMLFVYSRQDEKKFWMRNTYIALDMIFIDEGFKVAGVLENVPILNDEPRTIGKPSRYVVELKAGTAAKHGITAGAALKLASPLQGGSCA